MTVSLELAKKLKEAGWEKETDFYYAMHRPHKNEWLLVGPKYDWHYFGDKEIFDWGCGKCCEGVKNVYDTSPAPITDELLEALPATIEIKHDDWSLYLLKDKHGFTAFLGGDGVYEFIIEHDYEFKAPAPADALAKLWLKLKEENLIE